MTNFITIRKKAEESVGVFTEFSIRNLIQEAQENGLIDAGPIIRLGRRVLLDEQRFDDWVLSHGVGGGSSC